MKKVFPFSLLLVGSVSFCMEKDLCGEEKRPSWGGYNPPASRFQPQQQEEILASMMSSLSTIAQGINEQGQFLKKKLEIEEERLRVEKARLEIEKEKLLLKKTMVKLNCSRHLQGQQEPSSVSEKEEEE